MYLTFDEGYVHPCHMSSIHACWNPKLKMCDQLKGQMNNFIKVNG